MERYLQKHRLEIDGWNEVFIAKLQNIGRTVYGTPEYDSKRSGFVP